MSRHFDHSARFWLLAWFFGVSTPLFAGHFCGLMVASGNLEAFDVGMAQIRESRIASKKQLYAPANTHPFPTELTIYQMKEDLRIASEARARTANIFSLYVPALALSRPYLNPTITPEPSSGQTWGREYEMAKHRRDSEGTSRDNSIYGLRDRWKLCSETGLLDGIDIHAVEIESTDSGAGFAAGALVCAMIGLHTGSRIAEGLAREFAKRAIKQAIRATVAADEKRALATYVAALQASYAVARPRPETLHIAIVVDGFSNVQRVSNYLVRNNGFLD